MKTQSWRGESLTDQLAKEYPELARHAEETTGLPELASALIQLRARGGLRQADLAKAGGLPVTLISELENAHNNGVAWRTLQRLAKGAGARIELSFIIDPPNAGEVNVSVVGEYAESPGAVTIANLIDERNTAVRDSGPLLAA